MERSRFPGCGKPVLPASRTMTYQTRRAFLQSVPIAAASAGIAGAVVPEAPTPTREELTAKLKAVLEAETGTVWVDTSSKKAGAICLIDLGRPLEVRQ